MKHNLVLFLKFFSFLMFPFFFIFVNAEVKVVKLVPPKLEAEYLDEKIICYRPGRYRSPKMSIEEKNEKVIVHNYGHGGIGWTLAPGATKYMNNKLLNKYGIKKEEAITVIGGGVIGLFSACDLLEKGFNNIVIVADKFEKLPSHTAGGRFGPSSMITARKYEDIVNTLIVDSYRFYLQVFRKKCKFLKEGIHIMPAYFKDRESSGLERFVGKIIKSAEDVILDFQNGTKREMVAYNDLIFFDTNKIINEMLIYLRSKKVRFERKKISSFSEVDSRIILNCAGIGARELNNDENVYPIQGHLIMLKDQNPKEQGYMISVKLYEGKTENGQKVEYSFYFMPKPWFRGGTSDIGVIGGTYIKGADNRTPNIKEFDNVLSAARKFYGIT